MRQNSKTLETCQLTCELDFMSIWTIIIVPIVGVWFYENFGRGWLPLTWIWAVLYHHVNKFSFLWCANLSEMRQFCSTASSPEHNCLGKIRVFTSSMHTNFTLIYFFKFSLTFSPCCFRLNTVWRWIPEAPNVLPAAKAKNPSDVKYTQLMLVLQILPEAINLPAFIICTIKS